MTETAAATSVKQGTQAPGDAAHATLDADAAQLLAPPELLAGFRVVTDGRFNIERIEHHVHVTVIGNCGENPAANPERGIAPMWQLFCFG